jgi:poly-beta-hydroxyalkanoate depolymerase
VRLVFQEARLARRELLHRGVPVDLGAIGHYGVFSGRRWETQIYPIIRNLTLSTG